MRDGTAGGGKVGLVVPGTGGAVEVEGDAVGAGEDGAVAGGVGGKHGWLVGGLGWGDRNEE